MIEGIIITPLKEIKALGGNVLHAMKSLDKGYNGFGEAYFSIVEKGIIKGWKRHNLMTLNLVVPIGEIRFVIFDDRKGSLTYGEFQKIVLSRKQYSRLTVPPLLWIGFHGLGEKDSMLLNVVNIPHDSKEVVSKNLDDFDFDWGVN